MADDAQMKIRLPRPLKERIEEAAMGWNRSLNAEIVLRLEQSFKDAGPLDEQVRAMRGELDDLREEVRSLRRLVNSELD